MNSLSQLPSVDQALTSSSGKKMEEKYGHNPVVKAIRASLDQARQEHLQEGSAVPDLVSILVTAESLLFRFGNELELPMKVQKVAIDMLRTASKNGLQRTGKNPDQKHH